MQRTILFDGRLILEKPTGIGRYITSLLPEMVQQAPDWHFYFLRRPKLWPGYEIDAWTAPNLTHYSSQVPHMSPRQHLWLPRLARQLKVDLLHYPHFDAPVLWQPVPVIVTLHDVKYLVRPDFFTRLRGPKRWYMRFFFGQSVRRAAAVITVSQRTAADVQRLFQVPPAKVHVIHEAASSQFQPASVEAVQAFRARFGLPRPFILTVGERRPHKNHAGLVRAYAQSASRQTHDLVIIGEDYEGYREPEELVRRLGLDKRIHFPGAVSAPDLVAAYTAADLFVLISLYEGFGLPILEAMACKTPVLASSTTAAAEVVGSGGLTVNPEDEDAIARAMDEVLGDRQKRTQLIAKAQTWRKSFTWQRAAAETLAVYRKAMRNSCSP